MTTTVGAHTHPSLLAPSLGGASFASALPLSGLSVAAASLSSRGDAPQNPQNPLGADFGSGSAMRVGPPQPQAAISTALDGAYQTLLRGDLAGTYTDPYTGVTREYYTAAMPEPRVMRATPVIRLGEPSRALEMLTGVSNLSTASAAARQGRPAEMETDWNDVMVGAQLPQGMVNEWVREQMAARAARETFWTNNEVPAGFNDRHPDGCIGTTYVMRPVIDTQTLADNNETNTVVNPRAAFMPPTGAADVVDLGAAATRWGGHLAPAVTVLAQDQATGLPRPALDDLARFGENAAYASHVPVFDRAFTGDATSTQRASLPSHVAAPASHDAAGGAAHDARHARDAYAVPPTTLITDVRHGDASLPPAAASRAHVRDAVATVRTGGVAAAAVDMPPPLMSVVRDASTTSLRDMAAAVTRFVASLDQGTVGAAARGASIATATDVARAASMRDNAATHAHAAPGLNIAAAMGTDIAAAMGTATDRAAAGLRDAAAAPQSRHYITATHDAATAMAPAHDTYHSGLRDATAPQITAGFQNHMQHMPHVQHTAAQLAVVHDANARDVDMRAVAPQQRVAVNVAVDHGQQLFAAVDDRQRVRTDPAALPQRAHVEHHATAPMATAFEGVNQARDATELRRGVQPTHVNHADTAQWTKTSDRFVPERANYGPRVGTDRTLTGLLGAVNNIGFAAAQTSAPPLSFAPIVCDRGAAADAALGDRFLRDIVHREVASLSHPSTFHAGAAFRNEYTLPVIPGREDANATTTQLTFGGPERRAREALLSKRAARPSTPFHHVMRRTGTPLESDVDDSGTEYSETDADTDSDTDSEYGF